ESGAQHQASIASLECGVHEALTDRSVSRSFLIFLHLVTTVRIGENPIKLFPFSSTHNPC
ncbi:hypothetical protein, partial [Pseudomonas syringae]|uniref:hypothetical protein n=1 Tax=Pseudomonas syringae TaxID=317 RepID=UPI001C7E2739